jgi:sporulation protein YlmC with PRC-barrel domain
MAGRILHAQLHLLDRQVVDHRTGRLLGKVDDVELDLDGPVPVVGALLSGPQALGGRFNGRLGRLIRAVHRRLHPAPNPGPNWIPAARIVEIDSAVHIDSRGLRLEGFEEWVERTVIARIPGAGDAPE